MDMMIFMLIIFVCLLDFAHMKASPLLGKGSYFGLAVICLASMAFEQGGNYINTEPRFLWSRPKIKFSVSLCKEQGGTEDLF